MNGRSLLCCALAALLMTACGGDGGSADVGTDSTRAAPGTPVPQAGPQTAPAPAPPPGPPPPPPPPGSVAGRSYADCEAETRGKSAEERAVMLRACANLPGAPR